MTAPQTVTLAFTGASGMPYGLRLLECLLAAGVPRLPALLAGGADRRQAGVRPHAAGAAARGGALLGERFGAADGQLTVFGREDWMAPVASGSNPADAMVDLSLQHGHAGRRSPTDSPTT